MADVFENIKMSDVVGDITSTLDIQRENGDIKDPLLEPPKKKDPPKQEPVEQEAEEIDLSELEEVLEANEFDGDEKQALLDDLKARAEKGESVDDLKKELEDEIANLENEEPPKDEPVADKGKTEKVIEKLQKRIDSLTAQVKSQEQKNEKKPDDNDAKLDAMTSEELEDLHDDVELMVMEGKDDKGDELTRDGKKKLVALKRKVSNLITTAPQRFRSKQIAQLSKILPELEQLHPDVVDQIKTGKGDLAEAAARIYQKMKSLHTSTNGLVEAFHLAADYLAERGEVAVNKDTEEKSSLRRRLNTLKKKTVLSGRQSVANKPNVSSKKAFAKAVEGDMDDKADWVGENILPSLGFK